MDRHRGNGRVAQPHGPVRRRILQGSDAGHRTHQRRTARMDHGLEPQPGTRPRPRLAGGGGTARAPLTRHPRTIRHRRAEAVARAGMAPIARHQPLWDALCWTWRDGDAPQHYAPILADRRMPVRDLALFVHKIAHTDLLETADKTAILSNLFESYSAHDKHGSTIWTDTTIGGMARTLMPGTDDHTRSPNGSPPTCPSANGSGASPATCPKTCAKGRSTTPTARRHAPSTRARTTTRRSAHAARNSSDNGGSSRSTPRRARRPDGRGTARTRGRSAGTRTAHPAGDRADQGAAGGPVDPRQGRPRLHDGDVQRARPRAHARQALPVLGRLDPPARTMARRLLGRRRHRLQGSKDVRHRGPQPVPTAGGVPGQRADHRHQGLPTETTASGKPKRVKDQKATMAAIEKANAIRDAWNQWVFKDPDRAQRLTALYNRRFNGMRPRHVDGSYLTTPGITHGVALRPHQKDAVARACAATRAPSSRTSSEPARRSRASHSPTRRNVSARRPSRCSWSPTTSWTSGPATCSGSIRPAESSSWTRTRNATPNR